MNAPQTMPGFLSPSLQAKDDGGGQAFEVKYLIDEALAEQVDEWSRRRLTPDPHGDPALRGAYTTHSLYCDTPEMDVYFRRPMYRRRKYRVRRYGLAPWVFLERKARKGDRVAKRRTVLAYDDLPLLAQDGLPDDWSGRWFQRRLASRRLGPACHVIYQRAAFVGESAGSAVRLTMDREVHGTLAGDWSLPTVFDAIPLLHGQVILELKFRVAMPAPFKEIVAEMRLQPTAVSKYRRCREAWGLPASHEREVTDA